MKRYLSILLAIVLVIMQVPSVGLAVGDKDDVVVGSSTDIIVKKVSTDISKIKENSSFRLTLTLENNYVNKENLKGVAVGIEKSSSFRLSGTGSKQTFNFENNIATVNFDLTYNGGDDIQLPITIYYTIDGKDASFSDYVSITQAIPTSSNLEPEVDESKLVPNISIVSSKTTIGEAGDSISIPVSIKNTSEHSAYDISVTVELVGDSPLYIDGSGYSSVSRLHGGRSEDLSFKVKVDKTAEDKTYPIKVSLQYYNEYGIPSPSSDNTIYVKVSNKNTGAQVVINNVDIKPANEIQPGAMVMVGFELENKGDGPAKDVKVSLQGLTNEGFSLASGLNNQTVPLLEKGKARTVYFQLKSSKKMGAGNHDLEVVLSYKDTKNQEITDENKFFIPVASNKNQSSNLIIQDISYPTGAIGQNKDVDVSFTIRNQGQTDAENIVIKAESSDPAGLVPKSVSVIKLNSLAPGATEKLNYKFLTTKTAETKNYPINITVEYEDDLSSPDEKLSVNQFVGIFVLAPDDSIKSTPKLIIDKYSFNPTLVKAGENFEMSLSFFNTNSGKTVKNIKIFLTAEPNVGSDPNSPNNGSSVFTPVNSSNTFYMDSIAPKGRVEKTITMFTIPDAVAKTHMITANFEYEDEKGEEYTATELIGVPVVQQSKLETGELNYSPDAFMGQPTPISLEFFNTGKVTLYNMMVKLEGDFQTESGSYYIGNFENGNSEYFEGMVIPSQPGELNGAVLFTYEDSTGQEQELRKEFTLNVMDAPPMEEFPDDFPPMDEGPGGIKGILTSKWLWIALVLAGGGFGGFKFYKKNKRDKEMALDE